MKLFQAIKSKLPVSRKAHAAAIDKAVIDSNGWILGQLKQVTAANIRLEAKLHQEGK